MSTIFNTSYAESLRRIQGERRDSRTGERQGSSGPQAKAQANDFPELLSQLEQRIKETPERQAPAPQPEKSARASLISFDPKGNGAPEAITNLSLTETADFLSARPEGQTGSQNSATEAYRLSRNDLNMEGNGGVLAAETLLAIPSRLMPSAKAPQPMLPLIAEAGRTPASPKMFSAKRVEQNLIAALAPPVIDPKSPAGLLPYSDEALEEIITGAGRRHGVDPSLSIAVAKAESSLRPDAVSKDGHHSKGMFQLLDATGRDLMERLSMDGSYDPFNANQNAHLGVAYLRRLHDLFSQESTLSAGLKTIPVKSAGDLEKFAVAAFNAGEGNVARAQQHAKAHGKNPASFEAIKAYLPASTRSYVERVAHLKARMTPGEEGDVLA